MSENKNLNQGEWVPCGVAYLSKSGKGFMLSLNGEKYTLTVEGVKGVLDGSVTNLDISRLVKK